MNDKRKRWQTFARTVDTLSASALALEELRALEADASDQGSTETFVALAASAEGPLERVELRNERRTLTITLAQSDDGVEVAVEASGFAAIEEWRGARGLLRFDPSGVATTLTFDNRGRAEKFIAGVEPSALAQDRVIINRI